MIEESIYIIKRKVLQGWILSFFAFEYWSILEYCEELWLNKSTGFPGIVFFHRKHPPPQIFDTIEKVGALAIKFRWDWRMDGDFAHFQVIPDKKYRPAGGGMKWWPIFFPPILMK